MIFHDKILHSCTLWSGQLYLSDKDENFQHTNEIWLGEQGTGVHSTKGFSIII